MVLFFKSKYVCQVLARGQVFNVTLYAVKLYYVYTV